MARKNETEDSKNVKRREKLVQTAARLFNKNGYERTTVRQVAAEVGLTSGSIFYYFESKEALLEEVIAYGMKSGLVLVEERLSDVTGPLSRFHALLLAHLSAITGRPGNAHEVSFSEWKRLPIQSRERLRSLNNLYREIWLQVLNELKFHGYLFSSSEHSRLMLIAALNWSPVWTGVTTGPQLEKAADHFCSVALNMRESEFHDHRKAEQRKEYASDVT